MNTRQVFLGALIGIFFFVSENAVSEEIQRLCFTDQHLRLIRASRMVWDPTENGAPLVHPEEPFGSRDVLGDAAVLTGLLDRPKATGGILSFFVERRVKLSKDLKERAEQYLGQLLSSMQIFLLHADLRPGEYTIQVREPRTFSTGATAQVDFYRSEAEKTLVTMKPPVLKDGSFMFTEEHRKLLRRAAMFLEENTWSKEEPSRFHPLPALDPKRPYGDMTYYPIDVADELGINLDNPVEESSDPPFKLPKLKRLVDLHLSMLTAFVVFLNEATLEFGEFKMGVNGAWERNGRGVCQGGSPVHSPVRLME